MFKDLMKMGLGLGILVLHWYTQSPIILYLLGVLYTISILILSAVNILILKGHEFPYTKITNFKWIISYIQVVIFFSYFLYTSSFILATLVLLSFILVLIFKIICTKK